MKIRMRDGSGVLDLLHLVEDMDRHGNVRVYFRRSGKKVRIREKLGTEAFLAVYRALLKGDTIQSDAAGELMPPATPGSLRWLVVRYYNSADFKSLVRPAPRRAILDRICIQDGAKPYALMKARHVKKLRDSRLDAPEAANAIVKSLRRLFAWAIEDEHADENPARDVKYLQTASEGFHTWAVDEIERYWERHPLGTKARLALDLLLLSGVRRSDVVKMGPQMARRGWHIFTETKGRSRKVKVREIPILPALQRSLDAYKSGHLTYLVTEFGKPFTANGFGNWFRKRCDEAGLPHCTSHGLRKAGSVIASENRATIQQLMAMYGWETEKEAIRYSRRANRKRLAGEAMHLLEPEQKMDASVPLSGPEVSHRKIS